MEKEHRDIISKNINSIIENTDIEILLPRLESFGIFPQVLIHKYKDAGLQERKRLVFEDIQKRGPNAFNLLLKACQETGHLQLYNILVKTIPSIPEYQKVSADGPICSKTKKPDPAYDQNDYYKSGAHPFQLPAFNGDNLTEILENSPVDTLLNLNIRRQMIKVRHATEWMDAPTSTKHKLPPYPMRSANRGAVLIINNKYFDLDLHEPRNGAEVDQACLEELFQQFGFKIVTWQNLTLVDMKSKIQNFIQDPILYDVDCCFVVIMSHGNQGVSVEETNIVTYDNGLYPTYDLISNFSSMNCPALIQKPKVFLFQTCRGKFTDKGVPVNPKNSRRGVETDGGSVSIKHLEPILSNVCVCYSSYAGYESYRDPHTGSWFIDKLCKVFMNQAHDTDVQEMLKLVAHETKELQSQSGNRQTPEIRDILFRPLYLNPGLVKTQDMDGQ